MEASWPDPRPGAGLGGLGPEVGGEIPLVVRVSDPEHSGGCVDRPLVAQLAEVTVERDSY